jgi:hypothetical protein
MPRETHPCPLVGDFAPPLGYEWTATLGADGIGLVMLLNGDVVTAAKHRVENWEDVGCPDVIDVLKILALKLNEWHQLANALRRSGIDVQLETQIGGYRDRFSESPRATDARYG